MIVGPREVIRSEAVDGLTGPINPIPNEALDCGCGQLPCPKLAKYATRKLFIGLLCWIGFIQAAAQTYFVLTSSTIARRFQFGVNTMEWLLLATDGVLLFLIALPVAYWGDRIHRAAWTGSLVLIQSVGFLLFIIPHFTHPSTRIIEETTNVTHLSVYAEDNPELCAHGGLARITILEDDMCYVTFGIIVIALIVNCMGNVAFFSLGISYLDDNTRKWNVALPIAIVIGARIFGLVFGYLLAWGCLRLDAENLTKIVETYREQIGAWWLGWIILASLLAIPGLPMSWLPRRLPSEVIEQAAVSIVSESIGRRSPPSELPSVDEPAKVGDTAYFVSLWRLWTNRILMCNIFASAFCIMAIINYTYNEDIILEADFYIPRPTGLLSGFGDQFTSRIVTLLLRPIIIGTVIIISGLVIIKFRPTVKYLAGYNVIVIIITATMVLSLAFLSCVKPSIAGANHKEALTLLRYCNKNCRCSRDANFHPVCDSRGTSIFYTPCHAGCTGFDDSGGTKTYIGCSCIREITGSTNIEATDGPCHSTTCQISWIVFEVTSIIVYTLISTAVMSSFLIGLRSTYVQDKALSIALGLCLTALFTYVIGKLIYWIIAEKTCIHRGSASLRCLLHDSDTLGGYLSYFTALLLLIATIFQVLTFYFSQNIEIYRDSATNRYDSYLRPEQLIPLMESPLAGSQIPQDESERPHQRPTTSTTVPITDYINITDNERVNEGSSTEEKTQISVNDPHSEVETSDSRAESPEKMTAFRPSAFQLGKTLARESSFICDNNTIAASSKTKGIDFTKSTSNTQVRLPTGDFNEVGIPIVNYALSSINSGRIRSILDVPEMLEEAARENILEDLKLQDISEGVGKGLSPVEHTSSGFGSCSSDLHKANANSSGSLPVTGISEIEGSSTTSSVASIIRGTKLSYTTAL